MLVEKKRIDLNCDTQERVEKIFQGPEFTLVSLTPQIAIQSSRLPGEMHGDLADCILVATAFDKHAVLVTHDENSSNMEKVVSFQYIS